MQLRFLGSEECGLAFITRPTHRVALVEKCYIDEGLERRLAQPQPISGQRSIVPWIMRIR